MYVVRPIEGKGNGFIVTVNIPRHSVVIHSMLPTLPHHLRHTNFLGELLETGSAAVIAHRLCGTSSAEKIQLTYALYISRTEGYKKWPRF